MTEPRSNRHAWWLAVIAIAGLAVTTGGCGKRKMRELKDNATADEAGRPHAPKPEVRTVSLEADGIRLVGTTLGILAGDGAGLVVGPGRPLPGSSFVDGDLVALGLPAAERRTLPPPPVAGADFILHAGERWGQRMWTSRMQPGVQQLLALSPAGPPLGYRLDRVGEFDWAPLADDQVAAISPVAHSPTEFEVIHARPDAEPTTVGRGRLLDGMTPLGLSAMGEAAWLLATDRDGALRFRALADGADWSPPRPLGFRDPVFVHRCTADAAWVLLSSTQGVVVVRIAPGKPPAIAFADPQRTANALRCRGATAIVAGPSAGSVLRCQASGCADLTLPEGNLTDVDLGTGDRVWAVLERSDHLVAFATDPTGSRWDDGQQLPAAWRSSDSVRVVDAGSARWAVSAHTGGGFQILALSPPSSYHPTPAPKPLGPHARVPR